MISFRKTVLATVALAGVVIASAAYARGEVEDYALAVIKPEERGKVSSYAGYTKRLVDEHGFYATIISSTETVDNPRPGLWRIVTPDFNPGAPPYVCLATADAGRRPGMTMAALQARIGEAITPGSPFDRYAARDMDSVRTRGIETLRGVAGKPGPKIAVWGGPRGARYTVIGILPAPAGTLIIGCTGPNAADTLQNMIAAFTPAAGLL